MSACPLCAINGLMQCSKAVKAESANSLDFTQDKICALLGGMSKHTLEKHFREELDRGMAVTHYKVANSLVDNALAGNVTAQIWYTKAQMGWKETQVVERQESRLEVMSDDEIIRELADRANKLGVKIDMSIGEQHPHALERNHRRGGKRRG